MNAHVSAVANEAYRWAVAESKSAEHSCNLGSDYFLALEQKKFAELLIRECAAVAARTQAEAMDWDISEVLLEHYGLVDTAPSERPYVRKR